MRMPVPARTGGRSGRKAGESACVPCPFRRKESIFSQGKEVNDGCRKGTRAFCLRRRLPERACVPALAQQTVSTAPLRGIFRGDAKRSTPYDLSFREKTRASRWRWAGRRVPTPRIPFFQGQQPRAIPHGKCGSLWWSRERLPATEHMEKPRFFRSVRAASALRLDTISMLIRSRRRPGRAWNRSA